METMAAWPQKEDMSDLILAKIDSARMALLACKNAGEAKKVAAKSNPKPVIVELPALVLADPPWRYEHCEADNREIENHYGTATLEDIYKHSPKTTSDAILFLWATAPKLDEALSVLKAWGFSYRSCAVWDKQKIGMGYWWRIQHELLLVGIKGNPGCTPESARVSLEEWSAEETCNPGWVIKPLFADYIAYAIAPAGKCYLLPVLQLQQAWLIHSSRWKHQIGRRIEAKNNGYTTISYERTTNNAQRNNVRCRAHERQRHTWTSGPHSRGHVQGDERK